MSAAGDPLVTLATADRDVVTLGATSWVGALAVPGLVVRGSRRSRSPSSRLDGSYAAVCRSLDALTDLVPELADAPGEVEVTTLIRAHL